MNRNRWVLLANACIIIWVFVFPTSHRMIVALLSLLLVNAVVISVVWRKSGSPKKTRKEWLFNIGWGIAMLAAIYWTLEQFWH